MSTSFSRRRFMQASTGLAVSAVLPVGGSAVRAQATPDAEPGFTEVLVTMSPEAGSHYALPGTTIAFRGVTLDQIGNVFVTGSLSGSASGVLREHSDGQGVSWYHDATFLETETVTVRADIPLTNAEDGSATFVIGEQAPRPASSITEDRSAASEDDSIVQSFRSRPDLAPVRIDVSLLDENRVAPGLIAVTPHIPEGQAGATIVDNAGETVWHYIPADINHVVYCLKMQTYNGESVLTWSEGTSHVGWGYGHFVIVNQSYEVIAHVQAGHGVNGLDVHDMVLTEYGTAWVFSYHTVFLDMDGDRRNIMECVIQEIDVATGDVWWEWHSLDHVPLEDSFGNLPDNPANAWDYIHVNSIHVDHDGNLLISSRTNHCIYKINTINHQVIWRLGGKSSDFPLAEDAVFHWQHDAQRRTDGTLSLFDNHDSDNTVDSRGMVFQIDEEAMTADLVQEFYRDGGMHSPYQANMQTLDNGNVFIGWGSGPRCSEFTSEGEMIFDMRYRAGVSYRGYRVDWSATPVAPMDYVLEDGPDGTVTAFISWNGATDVAEWRVVAGPDASSAVEVGRAPKSSFETEIAGIPIATYMEAQALNAQGLILGGRVLLRGG